jgi:hypothetical protein
MKHTNLIQLKTLNDVRLLLPAIYFPQTGLKPPASSRSALA